MSVEEYHPERWDSPSGKFKPLIEAFDSYYVMVSHEELDSLVGRLMQMCELAGDTEQRRALKDEIKQRSRQWLDHLYEDSGYKKWVNPDEKPLRDGYNAVKI